ncbi:MAG: FIST N-terminal domain-containing protein [Pseudomonadota bacterium]
MTGERVSGFSLGCAEHTDWAICCDQAIADLDGATGTLGFLYVTDAFVNAMPGIINRLRDKTGVTDWVGSVGLGICATGVEYFERPALAVLLTSLDPADYRLIGTDGEDWSSVESACATVRGGAYFGMVHADPTNPNVATILSDLPGKASDAFFVGGLTSSQSTHWQVANQVSQGGVSGVLLGSEVPVRTQLTQGCTPIGPRHEVTRSERNFVVELDGRPALDVFREDIGEILARDLRRVAGYIFAALPIADTDTGDYLVRNLVGVDPRTGVVAIGELVEPGQKLMFCRRDHNTAREDMVRMLEDLKGSLAGPPQAGVYFTCLARGPNLFGPNGEEVQMIRDVLGDFPMVGFFGNGEISNNRLYAYTGVLSVFT